jgi:translation initiation factor 2B subunit (eIF-2B alpha/beta/delta family)
MVFEDLGSVEKRLGKNLLKSSQTFESTPLDYFHRFVTDRGVLRPMDVRSKLKDYRKALAW